MDASSVDKLSVHDYVPSPQHMGDCRICGHVQDATIHGYPPRRKTVPEMLASLGDLYKKRNKLFRNNYKHFGKVMLGMFPNGLTLKTEADFNRLGIFVQLASKMTRYGQQFADGGHTDSLDDIAVYAQMLQEFDREVRDV